MQSVTRSTVIEAPIERVWAVLRDFNSHVQWHPAIAHSEIEGRDSPTQVGCVRAFGLHDGNRLREQLLSLNDHDHAFSYCILQASLPLRRYVATVQPAAHHRWEAVLLAMVVYFRGSGRP
jgi:NADPH:quinone reductase